VLTPSSVAATWFSKARQSRFYLVIVCGVAIGLVSASSITELGIILAFLLGLPILVATIVSPLAWVCLEVVSCLATPEYYVHGTPVGLQDVLLLTGLLGILYQRHSVDDPARRANEVGLPRSLALFLFFVLVSVGFSFMIFNPSVGIYSLSHFFRLVEEVFPLVYLYAQREIANWRLVYTLSLALAAFSSLTGILEFVTQTTFLNPVHAAQYIYLHGKIMLRAQGVFAESSSFGSFNAFLFLVSCASLSMSGNARRTKLAYLSLMAMSSAGVLLSDSREVSVGLLLAIGFLSLRVHGAARRRVITYSLALVVIASLASFLVDPNLIGKLLADRYASSIGGLFTNPNSTLSGRLEGWGVLISYLFRNPWTIFFGSGYETIGQAAPLLNNFGDNQYLSFLLETGITGLLGFLVFFRSLWKMSLCAASKEVAVSLAVRAYMFRLWGGWRWGMAFIFGV